jgi:hypothetical protein
MTWSWTQPCCMGCYFGKTGRQPVRMTDGQLEICCYCGHDTVEGIFVRVNPKEVQWPTRQKTD